MKKIAALIVVLIAAFAIYVKWAISKFEYDYDIKKLVPVRINRSEGGVLNMVIEVVIKSALFFNLPVQALYYEVYFKDNMIGKSADTRGFTINKSGSTTINQSVDLFINKKTIEVAENYALKKPTDYLVKVYVKIFGIGIKLTNIKFTY